MIGFFSYLAGWYSSAWFRLPLSLRLAKNGKVFFYSLISLAIAAFFLQFHLFSRTFLVLFVALGFLAQGALEYWGGRAHRRIRKILCLGPSVLVKGLSAWAREKDLNLIFLHPESDQLEEEQILPAILKYEPDEVILLGHEKTSGSLVGRLQDSIFSYGLRTRVRDLSILLKVFPRAKRFNRYDRYIRELLCEPGPKDWSMRWKRIFDLLVVLFFSPVLIGLFLLIFLLLKIRNGRAIYRQERIGQLGEVFSIYKFCTLADEGDRQKPFAAEDRNLLPFGWILRRTSLDEIPQFLNVLKGEMSLVGPRPEMVPIVEKNYGSIHWKRVLLKPGLTGLWQIHGRRQPIHDHLKYDFFYLHHQSFWLDLVILVQTFPAVIFGRGAR